MGKSSYLQGAVRYGRHTVATHASRLHTSILTPGGHSKKKKEFVRNGQKHEIYKSFTHRQKCNSTE